MRNRELTMQTTLLLTLALALAGAFLPAAAGASSYAWKHTSNGNWDAGGNWTRTGSGTTNYPNSSGDTAQIYSLAGYNPVISLHKKSYVVGYLDLQQTGSYTTYLDLGSDSTAYGITVYYDYNNNLFGSGNSFTRRPQNVLGSTGYINAYNAGQQITGTNVSGARLPPLLWPWVTSTSVRARHPHTRSGTAEPRPPSGGRSRQVVPLPATSLTAGCRAQASRPAISVS